MKNEQITNRVNELKEEINAHYKLFHEFPELSEKEFETSKYLKQYVNGLGLKVVESSPTGFYSVLETGRAGKTVGLRCDIDALPVIESEMNLKHKRVIRSKVDGVMHACGHDGHMTIQLAVMKILVENIDSLNGKIVFIFEDGEEAGDGIYHMIDAIKDLGIDVIYGTHIAAFMDTGQICIDDGARMAGAKGIEFNVNGRSGHGSRPDHAINPIFAAANILSGLTSAWVNQIDITKTVTLGISQIHAGTANNVIPETCKVSGSIRYYDEKEGLRAKEIIYKVATDIASAHNCTVEVIKTGGTLPVMNDPEYSSKARESVNQILPSALVSGVSWFASESFALYSSVAPLVFMFSGTRNENKGTGADHHNEHFEIDLDTLQYSIISTVKIIQDILQ